MENKIVIATRMLAHSNIENRPKILEVIHESFGEECEIFYMQALNDSNYKMRISAIKILADLYGKDAIKYIEPLQKDKNFWVRRAATKYYKMIEEGSLKNK